MSGVSRKNDECAHAVLLLYPEEVNGVEKCRYKGAKKVQIAT
jgi:hypothetical protein